MKFIKKLTRQIMLLLLICMLFTGCKSKKESDIPTESNHIDNTEEIESSITYRKEKNLLKRRKQVQYLKRMKLKPQKGWKTIIR